jgi:mRNA-degrading endonuclease RelE of RelBE toxin-antitoxin system
VALKIFWADEARTDVRGLDRPTAMRLFDSLYRYAISGEGNVQTLQGKHAGKLRLRIGDYRLFFRNDEDGLRVLAVKHRGEAYR